MLYLWYIHIVQIQSLYSSLVKISREFSLYFSSLFPNKLIIFFLTSVTSFTKTLSIIIKCYNFICIVDVPVWARFKLASIFWTVVHWNIVLQICSVKLFLEKRRPSKWTSKFCFRKRFSLETLDLNLFFV